MIAWANLWKWCCFTPGTWWKRVLLTGWQLGLMAGPLAGYLWLGPWGVAGGFVGAFFAHELLFSAYARWVARAPTMDDGNIVGQDHRADYTFERWIGPVC